MSNGRLPSLPFWRNFDGFGPIIIFFLISFFSLFAYGVDAGAHHTYNIYYHHIFAHPEKFIGTPLELILVGKGAKLFTLGLENILLDPTSVLLMSILFNVAILYVANRIAGIFLTPLHALALTIVIGLVANSPLAGLDSTELVFTRKTVTTLIMLSSFLYFFRHNYLLAGLLTAGGILLHPTNAVSALAFFIPGFTIYVCCTNKSHIYRLLLGAIPIFATLTLTYFFSEGLQQGHASSSIAEWYRYALAIEVDDVAMFWKLKVTAPYLFPLLIFSFAVSIRSLYRNNTNHNKAIDWICVTQLPIITLCVGLELLQIQGLSLGKASELFSGIQFRRGLWIPMLSALVVLQLHTAQLPKKSRGIWLLAIILAAVLDHTTLVILLLLGCLASLWPTKIVLSSAVISVVAVVWYVLTINGDDIGIHSLKHVLFFFGLVFVFLISQHFYGSRAGFATVLILHSAIILANNNLQHEVFRNSYLSLLSDQQQRSELSQSEAEVLKQLNGLEKYDQGVILFSPVALGYSAPIISDQPLFLTRWDNLLCFNRRIYDNFLERLSDLKIPPEICGTKYGSRIQCFLESAGRAIDHLTEQELLALQKKYNVLFVVRRTPLANRSPIFSNATYMVYKI